MRDRDSFEDGQIVTFRTEDWQALAQVTDVETVQRKWDSSKLRVPKEIDGKLYPYVVREFDKTWGKRGIDLIRWAYTQDEQSATWIFRKWVSEYHQGLAISKARWNAQQQAKADPLKVKPPSQCDPFTKFDVEDHIKARDALLREAYPNVFAAYETKDKDAIRRAYILDVVALTGTAPSEVTPDENFTRQLFRIYENRARSTGKAEETAEIKSELLRGWFKGYAFLSHEDRAKEVNKALRSTHSTEKIRTVLRSLGLVPKRQSGPSWKKA
jgi:hypothetical protein